MNEELLLYLSLKYSGDHLKITEAIDRQEKIDPDLQEKLLSNFNSSYITILSDDYPEKIKSRENPPYVLFYRGNIDLLTEQSIAFIGSHSLKGRNERDTLEKYILDLIWYDMPIISSTRLGTESYVLQQALSYNAKTIIVLPAGLDYYKSSLNSELFNRAERYGLIITQYPASTPLSEHTLNARQDMIASLCESILVSELDENELDEKDIALMNAASHQNKKIYITNIQNENFHSKYNLEYCHVKSVKDILYKEFEKTMNYEQTDRFNIIFMSLKKAVDIGALHLDPNNSDNIIIYRNKGEFSPEGWYSESITDIAYELLNNPDNYESYLNALMDYDSEPSNIDEEYDEYIKYCTDEYEIDI